MNDIFISYSRKDKAWVDRLARVLTKHGYRVWWDTNILPGQDFEKMIRNALKDSKCVITIWSQQSINSHWVKSESAIALEHGILIPVFFQKVEPPLPFGRIHSENLSDWGGSIDDENFQKLLASINNKCKNSEKLSNSSVKMPVLCMNLSSLQKNTPFIYLLFLLVLTFTYKTKHDNEPANNSQKITIGNNNKINNSVIENNSSETVRTPIANNPVNIHIRANQ